jgi:hypothetical protein
VLSCEPVKGEWSPEFGGSASAGRRSWALARRPWAEQYIFESVVRKRSP